MLLKERGAGAKQAIPKHSLVAHRASSAPHLYWSRSKLYAARVAFAPLLATHAAQVGAHQAHKERQEKRNLYEMHRTL